MTTPKYALMEIETKMLVNNAPLPDLSALPCTRIEIAISTADDCVCAQ